MAKLAKQQQTSMRVFLSHASADNVLARKVRNILWRSFDARVFTTEDLSAGENWESKLRGELAQSDYVVALLTPQSVSSNFLLHELGAAWALGKPIISVVTRRDVLNSLPLALSESQMIELADLDNPEISDQLVKRFGQIVGVTQP